ncbi:MAG: HDIG domain-containing protein [Candidatus Marinimicrobia bacterium]|nr:HDIG domain-containing protein [Candidatus Neomarinimicrobiota bacterium]
MPLPSRDEAWDLLCEYTESDALRKHARAVEQVMRTFAKSRGEDEELFGIIGMLHDFDYEKYPSMEEHPMVGSKILAQRGYPEEVRTAILGHAPYLHVPRESLAAKALFAFDELTGFVFAVTFVRPSKSIHEVKPKSVKKKLKQAKFAASVNRDDIEQGIEELQVDRDEHIQFVIDALKEIDTEIGLRGDISL